MRRSCFVAVLARVAVFLALAGLVSSCAPGVRPPAAEPERRTSPAATGLVVGLDLLGAAVLPHGLAYDTLAGDRVGGVSGLAFDPSTGHYVAISDDRDRPRLIAFALTVDASGVEAAPMSATMLDFVDRPGAPPMIDGEALVRLPDGGWLVASEGHAGQLPRVPPGIHRFDADGRYSGSLPVPDRFVPEAEGERRKGVRDNAAFESLTLAPGGRVLFTAAEGPLVQDDEPASFERGARTRILEYVQSGEGFRPAREFAYALDPVKGADLGFVPGEGDNGLVELLALGDGELLALERAFVREAGRQGRSANAIRIYHLTLDGATDVSALPSLRGASYRPVTKRLVLDLATIAAELPPELARLDNFEALAFGPRLPDGRETLIVASDDNFSPRQRTVFVLLGGR